LLARYPFLRETPSDNPRQRTAWNVRDAQATLILVSGGIDASPGTQFTLTCAKPPLVLNVAGPRESDVPGTYARAAHFLNGLLVDVR
jgi:hypothetical protein